MSDKIKTGAKGETLAAEFLKKKGFTIVARNYRLKKHEIDLIARRENWMIFVEVKTRSSNHFGEPEEFVDEQKANRIFHVAEHFIFATDWQGHVRFDVVSIKLSPGSEPEIVHFEDALN